MCQPTEGTIAMVPEMQEWVTGYVFWPSEGSYDGLFLDERLLNISVGI